MPRVRIQTGNPNLPVLSTGNKKKVHTDVIDEIGAIGDVMRDKNNIIIGTNYRLDAKSMKAAGNGFKAGDYKLDIQTVTRQKSQSVTVALAYVDPLAPSGSLQDLLDAFDDCLDTQDVYRVT